MGWLVQGALFVRGHVSYSVLSRSAASTSLTSSCAVARKSRKSESPITLEFHRHRSSNELARKN